MGVVFDVFLVHDMSSEPGFRGRSWFWIATCSQRGGFGDLWDGAVHLNENKGVWAFVCFWTLTCCQKGCLGLLLFFDHRLL